MGSNEKPKYLKFQLKQYWRSSHSLLHKNSEIQSHQKNLIDKYYERNNAAFA